MEIYMRKLLAILFAVAMVSGAKADEGMWMLPLVEKLNIQKMNGLGCTLSADEIYNDATVSLKDAVVVFGNGCTGVVVSDKGLVFTNHHCGYGAIQQHSSVENNYLKNGFTAENLEDEIPTPDLTIRFLVRIEDVTEKMLAQLPENLTGKERTQKQDSLANALRLDAEKDTHYIAQVKTFYSGNEFYLFVYEEFKDVRFAHAPPTSIGKFGGDTDNWMWPRHTGDYAVFRVYSAPDGKPADYSSENVPYQPKRFAAISTKGYHSGDFAMIMGNPGSTNRYLTSWGIKNRMYGGNKARIEIRGAKQDVWKRYMKEDEAINIAYASKYARSSNYWKNSIGMNNAIAKLGIIERKQQEEREFAEWVAAQPSRQQQYGRVLSVLQEANEKVFPYSKSIFYLREALLNGTDMARIAADLEFGMAQKLTKDSLISMATNLYKDYSPQVDESTFAVMLEEYKKSVNADVLPDVYQTIARKFKGNYSDYAKYVYQKSAFTSFEKFSKAIQSGKINVSKDPALVFRGSLKKTMDYLESDAYKLAQQELDDAERLYSAGLMEMANEKGVALYPDANFTMRLTYGEVKGYVPADAVKYNYYTTTKGILEKEIPDDMEFDVPQKLKTAIVNRDFGTYTDKNTGELHVAFLSTNDITGGNSGSPIFNGKGEVIGLAFDGNWEAMSGDIVFEPELQRTINVDIRYVLFVMDKIGNAQRLIRELTIH